MSIGAVWCMDGLGYNQPMEINILYTDDAIVVINKPAGMPVLPDGWEPDAPYVVKLLEEQYPKLMVVHRLDKVTSGVMVLARTVEAHRTLNIQFERHEAQKVYHALCNGNPRWDEHTAKHPLRINVGHKHRSMVDHAHGKPSQTKFKVLKRYTGYSLLECTPATGRTHQIRVHAYALGFPLVSDILYDAPPATFLFRPALHAISLTLTHPVSGEKMMFTAPYPEDFQYALQHLGQ